METIDDRHGGPYDRGSADSYYRRPRSPHFFEGGSYSSPRIDEAAMTPQQIAEYNQGFDDNEKNGDHKDW